MVRFRSSVEVFFWLIGSLILDHDLSIFSRHILYFWGPLILSVLGGYTLLPDILPDVFNLHFFLIDLFLKILNRLLQNIDSLTIMLCLFFKVWNCESLRKNLPLKVLYWCTFEKYILQELMLWKNWAINIFNLKFFQNLNPKFLNFQFALFL